MRLVPLGRRVVVQKDAPSDKVGSIVLPDRVKEKPVTGVIIAVPENTEGNDARLTVGQKVLFKQWAGEPIPGNLTGQPDLIVIHIDDLWASIVD